MESFDERRVVWKIVEKNENKHPRLRYACHAVLVVSTLLSCFFKVFNNRRSVSGSLITLTKLKFVGFSKRLFDERKKNDFYAVYILGAMR